MSVAETLVTKNESYGPPIRPRNKQWVYFLAVNSETVKIGYSSQGRGQRLAQHRSTKLGVKVDVQPLVEVNGVRADEQAIHRYFKHLLLPGEQEIFKPGDELIEYIRWLRDQFYVVVPEMSEAEINDVPSHPSSEWLPNEERRKRAPHQATLYGMQTLFNLGEREITGDDYYTNAIIINAARAVLGEVDLDPASHAIANRNVRAKRFFSVNDDGLSQQWSGRVWVNPPFGDWQRWAAKIVREWKSGRVTEMLVLAATRTITAQCMVPLLSECRAVAITKGRMPFWGPHATSSPDDGHFIAYFGNSEQTFIKHFGEICTVFRKGDLEC